MGKGPLPHEFLRRHADQLGISDDVLEQVEAIVGKLKTANGRLDGISRSSKLMFTMKWSKTIRIVRR